MNGYTEALSHFCFNLDYEAIPESVVRRAKWVILDGLGIIVGATASDFGRTIAKYTRGLGDRAEATVLGFGYKSSARSAAFANGSLSETLEMQDGYTKGGYHPCCGTISASLAIAEWRKMSGRELINAVVVGYEVGNRVAESIHPTHLYKGFQATGTVGTVGAAAAAAKLLGLDQEQLFNALGIAGFILPISTGDSLWGGYSIKPAHGGAAAKVGIEAAFLAQQGLKAAPLEGDSKVQKGFCRIVSDEPPKFEKMIDALGERYTIEEVYFKPYASCRMNHGAIDIAIDLRGKYGLKPEDIEAILIRSYRFAAQQAEAIRADANSSFTLCQFSMSYAVAAALTDGEFSLRQLSESRMRDPKIHSLASKVRVVADPELEKLFPASRPAIMEITRRNCEKVSGRVDDARGDPQNPMKEEELSAKFLSLTKDVVGEQKASKALDILLDLENLASVEKLIPYLT